MQMHGTLARQKLQKTWRKTKKRNEKKSKKENPESRKLQFSAENAKKAKCAARTQAHTQTQC